jgi:hypothetical protein
VSSPDALTACFGRQPFRFDVAQLSLGLGGPTTLLLCSDGIYKAASAEQMAAALRDGSASDGAGTLLSFVHACPEADNASAIVLRLHAQTTKTSAQPGRRETSAGTRPAREAGRNPVLSPEALAPHRPRVPGDGPSGSGRLEPASRRPAAPPSTARLLWTLVGAACALLFAALLLAAFMSTRGSSKDPAPAAAPRSTSSPSHVGAPPAPGTAPAAPATTSPPATSGSGAAAAESPEVPTPTVQATAGRAADAGGAVRSTEGDVSPDPAAASDVAPTPGADASPGATSGNQIGGSLRVGPFTVDAALRRESQESLAPAPRTQPEPGRSPFDSGWPPTDAGAAQ